MLGYFHALYGVLALLFGGRVLLTRKGTSSHVRIGKAYVVAMLSLNLSALGIYHLSGGFNAFHIMAIISLAMVGGGYLQVVYRPSPKWLWRHYQYMSWSYVGLLAATSNEAFVRVPALQSLTRSTTVHLPLFVMLVIVAVSALVVFSQQGRVLQQYRA